MAYIGLDIGTSGVKASVVDLEGNILIYKHKEYSLISPIPSMVEIDARVVWLSVKEVLSEIAKEFTSITALAVASFGEAIVLLDEKDCVMSNSIFYSDVRGTEEISDILKVLDKEKILKTTGMPINPMYSANKLLWIKKHESEIFKKSKKIMLFGDYITYMLTGEAVIDYSLASRTMLLHLDKKKWSMEIAGAGLPPLFGPKRKLVYAKF